MTAAAVRDPNAARLLAVLAAHPEGLSIAAIAAIDRRLSISRCSSAMQHLRALGLASARHEGDRVQVWRITPAGAAALVEEERPGG
jgi:DNA-binding IclR family transcriptional regulator